MSFAIVELCNSLWTIVLKDTIKSREGDIGHCFILDKYEEVTVIGNHSSYSLLHEMCLQQNRKTMTVNVNRNYYRSEKPACVDDLITSKTKKKCSKKLFISMPQDENNILQQLQMKTEFDIKCNSEISSIHESSHHSSDSPKSSR